MADNSYAMSSTRPTIIFTALNAAAVGVMWGLWAWAEWVGRQIEAAELGDADS